jgi:hypothetical protein
MFNPEAAMTSGAWRSTVTIELGGQTRRFARIITTRDAASYLVEQWPGSRDPAYKEAILTGTRALKGEIADEISFSCFVQATTASNLRYVSDPGLDADEFEQSIRGASRQYLLDEMDAVPAWTQGQVI